MSTKVEAKIENARKLAEAAREKSAEYAAKGAVKMAAFHAYKATEWDATADALAEFNL